MYFAAQKSVGIKLPPLNVEEVIVPRLLSANANYPQKFIQNFSFSRVNIKNVDEVMEALNKGVLLC